MILSSLHQNTFNNKCMGTVLSWDAVNREKSQSRKPPIKTSGKMTGEDDGR
jgi:hypothetical protein